jgi:hypothetical protein
MARNEAHGDKIGPLVAARPPGEAPLDALRQVLQQMLSELVTDPSVVRELQVMMSTPTLRKLAREHFYEEEAELVSAFAARLGRDERDLAANVMAGAAASTLWTVIDRWLAEGSEVDRLPSMIDQAFELLEQGLGPRPSTPRPPRQTTRSGRRRAASTSD